MKYMLMNSSSPYYTNLIDHEMLICMHACTCEAKAMQATDMPVTAFNDYQLATFVRLISGAHLIGSTSIHRSIRAFVHAWSVHTCSAVLAASLHLAHLSLARAHRLLAPISRVRDKSNENDEHILA